MRAWIINTKMERRRRKSWKTLWIAFHSLLPTPIYYMYYILLMSSTKSFPSNSLASGENIFLNFFLYLSPVPPCTVLEFTESQSMSNDLKNTFSNNFPEFQVGWFPFFPPALLPPLPFYPPYEELGIKPLNRS